jgi:hypothetical protein
LHFKNRKFIDYRKQAWLWSLGDTYRIKDRPRYMSAFTGNSAMDTSSYNSIRYSIGNVISDNNNIEVCEFSFNRFFLLSFFFKCK